ncbi:MAG: mechanosensitive ion channel family protein [Candidatus Cloacimonetes bacterium]|nr:mechanosensitive ion channel family protein [Candidatus Cloacimonadota bacterium]
MILDRVLYGEVTVLNLIFISAVLLLGIIMAKVLSLYLRRSLKSKLNKDHLEIIIKVVYYTIFTIVIIWVLSTLGFKLSGLLVAGGIAGIILGFASQSIVGNLVSGIFLMIERPMKLGHAVNIDGVIGVVDNISIISTTLRTYDGLDIRIPNEKVFTTNITNYVSNIARRFEFLVGIRYGDDADKAISLIKALIDREPFALKNPPPLVYVDNLGDNSVNITVKIWSPVSEWFALSQVMLLRIKQMLEENGMEIAFPQRVVWFGNHPENKS